MIPHGPSWSIMIHHDHHTSRKNGRTDLRTRLGGKKCPIGQIEPESLPSWVRVESEFQMWNVNKVTFPSVDRVEWLNIIIDKLWPHFGRWLQQVWASITSQSSEMMKNIKVAIYLHCDHCFQRRLLKTAENQLSTTFWHPSVSKRFHNSRSGNYFLRFWYFDDYWSGSPPWTGKCPAQAWRGEGVWEEHPWWWGGTIFIFSMPMIIIAL